MGQGFPLLRFQAAELKAREVWRAYLTNTWESPTLTLGSQTPKPGPLIPQGWIGPWVGGEEAWDGRYPKTIIEALAVQPETRL